MKKYILRRIIPQNECPGKCCKRSGVFPGKATKQCIYFDENLLGRRFGGCPFFNTDGTINQEKYAKLSIEDQNKFQHACNNWPVPDTVPEFDTPYDSNFGQHFGKSCGCFEWEIVDA